MPQPQRLLAALHAEIHACTLCLDAGYSIVPCGIVTGKMGAQVMTIGQAPGPTEVVAKRPFNAGSGKRLFEWLGEAGFEETAFRATQYMTAVTKCYPGKSRGRPGSGYPGKSSPGSGNGGGDRVPTPTEQALCRPYLEREIELVRPRLILPIGKLAIGLFFDPRLQLNAVIGQRIEQDGRVIVPLPHPSGASPWHHKEANRKLLRRAIAHIRAERIGLKL